MSDSALLGLLIGGPALAGFAVGLGGWRWFFAPAGGAAAVMVVLVAALSALTPEEQSSSSGYGIVIIPGAFLALAVYPGGLGVRYLILTALKRSGRAERSSVARTPSRPVAREGTSSYVPPYLPSKFQRRLAFAALIFVFPVSLVFLAIPGFRDTLRGRPIGGSGVRPADPGA
jgi:hypothetical protein